VFVGPSFAGVAKEFFLEAAVLIAVFPVLDSLIQKGKVSLYMVLGSEGLAVLLLAVAGILAAQAEQPKE
jgi:hypothetical protein